MLINIPYQSSCQPLICTITSWRTRIAWISIYSSLSFWPCIPWRSCVCCMFVWEDIYLHHSAAVATSSEILQAHANSIQHKYITSTCLNFSIICTISHIYCINSFESTANLYLLVLEVHVTLQMCVCVCVCWGVGEGRGGRGVWIESWWLMKSMFLRDC